MSIGGSSLVPGWRITLLSNSVGTDPVSVLGRVSLGALVLLCRGHRSNTGLDGRYLGISTSDVRCHQLIPKRRDFITQWI